MTVVDAPAGRRGQGALRRNGAFWRLWLGETTSVLGATVTGLLLSLVAVVALQASPLWVGLLNAAAWVPWVVIGLPAGALLDRLRPRRVMLATDLVSLLALLTIPIAWWLGRLSLLQLLVVELVTGTMTVLFRASYPKMVKLVAGKDQLEPANAWLAGSESTMHSAGPPLGGLVAAVVAPALGVVASAATYLVSFFCLLGLPDAQVERPADGPSFGRRIADGWRYTMGEPVLRFTALQGALANFGLTGFQTLLVLFFVRSVGLGPTMVGVALMCNSVGAVVGAAVAPWASRRVGSARIVLLTLLAVGPSALLVGYGGPGWRLVMTFVGLFLVGGLVVLANVVRQAWRQRYVPDELLSRSITSSQFINMGMMPLGALAAGAVAQRLGIEAGMLAMCWMVALASLGMLLAPFRRDRDLPEPGQD